MSDSFTPDAPVKDSFTPDAEPGKPKPGADVMAQLEHKAKGGFLTNPQGLTENAANLFVSSTGIGAGGAGLGALASRILPGASKAAPIVGRALTSGAIGAGETAGKGGSAYDIGSSFLKNAGLAAGGEGVLKVVGSGVPTGKALDLIEQRVGKGAWLEIPTLSKGPVSAREAMDKLAAASGAERKALTEEIAHALDAVQTQAGAKGAKAGQIFKDAVKDSRWTPEWATRFADAVRTKPLALGAFDTPVPALDVPLGAAAIGAGAIAGQESFGGIARKILPGMVH